MWKNPLHRVTLWLTIARSAPLTNRFTAENKPLDDVDRNTTSVSQSDVLNVPAHDKRDCTAQAGAFRIGRRHTVAAVVVRRRQAVVDVDASHPEACQRVARSRQQETVERTPTERKHAGSRKSVAEEPRREVTDASIVFVIEEQTDEYPLPSLFPGNPSEQASDVRTAGRISSGTDCRTTAPS